MALQLETRSDSKQAQNDLQKLQGAVNGISSSVDKASSKLSGFVSSISTAIIGSGIVLGYTKFSDTLANLDTRLKLVTKTQLEYNRALSSTRDLAIQSRQSLTNVTSLYATLAQSSSRFNASQNDVATVTETVAKSIALSGASAESAAAGITQLAQGLASGTLQGDELRSVLENTPRLARAIADGIGVTVGEMRDLGAEGKITSREVFQALLRQSKQINQEFKSVNVTYGQALTNLGNSFTILGSSISRALSGSTGSLPEFLNSIAIRIADFSKGLETKIIKSQNTVLRFVIDVVNYISEIPRKIVNIFKSIAEEAVGILTFEKLNIPPIDVGIVFKGLSFGVDTVKNWVEKVEGYFFWLYDRVIGNSWIPDLVLGVTYWFGKLLGVPFGIATKFVQTVSSLFSSIPFDAMYDKLKNVLSFLKNIAKEVYNTISNIGVDKQILEKGVTVTVTTAIVGTVAQQKDFFTRMKEAFSDGFKSSSGSFVDKLTQINNSIREFFNMGPNVRGPMRNNPNRPFFHDAINALPVQAQIPAIAAITAAVMGIIAIKTSGTVRDVLLGLTTTAAGLVIGTSVYDSEINRFTAKMVGAGQTIVNSIVQALFGSGIFGDKGFGGTLALIAKLSLLFKAGRDFLTNAAIGTAVAPTTLVNNLSTRFLANKAESELKIQEKALKNANDRLEKFNDITKRVTEDLARTRVGGQQVGSFNAKQLLDVTTQLPNTMSQALRQAVINARNTIQNETRDRDVTKRLIESQTQVVDALKTRASSLRGQVDKANEAFRTGILNTGSSIGGIFGTLGGFNIGQEIVKGMVNSSEWEKLLVQVSTTVIGQALGAAVGSAVSIALLAIGAALFGVITSVFFPAIAVFGTTIAALLNPEKFKEVINYLNDEIGPPIYNAFVEGTNFFVRTIAKFIDSNLGTSLESKLDPKPLKKEDIDSPIKEFGQALNAILTGDESKLPESLRYKAPDLRSVRRVDNRIDEGISNNFRERTLKNTPLYFLPKPGDNRERGETTLKLLQMEFSKTAMILRDAIVEGRPQKDIDLIQSRLTKYSDEMDYLVKFIKDAPTAFEKLGAATDYITDKFQKLGNFFQEIQYSIYPEIDPKNRGTVSRFAKGGFVSGFGGSKDDKIPALLSNGEYVVNASATKKNRKLLDSLNAGKKSKEFDPNSDFDPDIAYTHQLMAIYNQLSRMNLGKLATTILEDVNVNSLISDFKGYLTNVLFKKKSIVPKDPKIDKSTTSKINSFYANFATIDGRGEPYPPEVIMLPLADSINRENYPSVPNLIIELAKYQRWTGQSRQLDIADLNNYTRKVNSSSIIHSGIKQVKLLTKDFPMFNNLDYDGLNFILKAFTHLPWGMRIDNANNARMTGDTIKAISSPIDYPSFYNMDSPEILQNNLYDTAEDIFFKAVNFSKEIARAAYPDSFEEDPPGFYTFTKEVSNLFNELANKNTYATGGYISGPGGPTEDKIPAMLSNGEYVINAKSTKENLPLIKAINEGTFKGFANGGLVNISEEDKKKLLEAFQKIPAENRLRAFKEMISFAEGTQKLGYNTGYNNDPILSLDKFPYEARQFDIRTGRRLTSEEAMAAPRGTTTSAAGKYQILRGTYDDNAKELGITGFNPEVQDLIATNLLRKANALGDIVSGDIISALEKAGPIWASLPTAPYNQPKTDPGALANFFENYAANKDNLQVKIDAPKADFFSNPIEFLKGIYPKIEDAIFKAMGVKRDKEQAVPIEAIIDSISKITKRTVTADELRNNLTSNEYSALLAELRKIQEDQAKLDSDKFGSADKIGFSINVRESSAKVNAIVDKARKAVEKPISDIIDRIIDDDSSLFSFINEKLLPLNKKLNELTFGNLRNSESMDEVIYYLDQIESFTKQLETATGPIRRAIQNQIKVNTKALQDLIDINEQLTNENLRTKLPGQRPVSDKGKAFGEQFATIFQEDFNTALRNTLVSSSNRVPFFRALLDSFTNTIITGFVTSFTEALFDGFRLKDIFKNTGGRSFDFGTDLFKTLFPSLFGKTLNARPESSEKLNVPWNIPKTETIDDLPLMIEYVSPEAEKLVKRTDYENWFNNLSKDFSKVGDIFSMNLEDIGKLLKQGFTGTIQAIIQLFTVMAGTGGSSSFLSLIVSGFKALSGNPISPIPSTGMQPFADGGIVPGNLGAPQPILAHGGEVVLNREQQKKLLNGESSKNSQVFNIHITGDISRQTKTEIMRMIPQIAAGVNNHNYELGVRRT